MPDGCGGAAGASGRTGSTAAADSTDGGPCGVSTALAAAVAFSAFGGETASITANSVPSTTAAPSLTSTDDTRPATGDGISIDALSDSMTTSKSSIATSCPALTFTSTTVTSFASPMSGMRTSNRRDASTGLDGASFAAGGGRDCGCFAAGCGCGTACVGSADACSSPSLVDSISTTAIAWPVRTLSPSATMILRSVPETEAGTSIDALSDSITISGSSLPMCAPTLARISMTSTSSASPISGIRTSCCAITGPCCASDEPRIRFFGLDAEAAHRIPDYAARDDLFVGK